MPHVPQNSKWLSLSPRTKGLLQFRQSNSSTVREFDFYSLLSQDATEQFHASRVHCAFQKRFTWETVERHRLVVCPFKRRISNELGSDKRGNQIPFPFHHC